MTETLYRSIAEQSNEGIFVTRAEEIVYTNEKLLEWTGYREADLVGAPKTQLFAPGDEDRVETYHRQRIEGKSAPAQYRASLETSSGDSLPVEVSVSRITYEDDPAVVVFCRDFTEQKQREQELRRTHRQFETVLETMSAAVFLKDTDGQYLLMNRACRELFGVDEEEIAGLTDEDLFPGDVAEKARSDDRQVIESGETKEQEETVPTTEGNSTRITRKSPVYDDEGEITAICGVSTDITEQRRREWEVKRLKERFELAVGGANLGVWDWDMTTDEVEFNEQWAEMLGHSLEEIDSHLEEWEKRVHPDDIEAVEEALNDHIAGEVAYYDTEHRMRTADGDWKWIRDVGKVAERDENGDPVRAVGIHLDIDDRKTSERQLAEQREMFTQGPAVVFKWREAEGWPVEHVSENVEAVLGYTPSELQSGTVAYADIIHEEDRERVFQEVDENSAEGTEQFSHEPYRVVTADGTVRWVLDYTRNIWQDGEITHRLGYLVDITEQRQSEIYLQNAQEVADIGWWRKEIPSDQIYWSEPVYEMWGADGEIGYLDHDKFLEFIHPEDEERVDQAWQAALDGVPYDVEHRIVTGDGEVRWMREVAEFTRDAAGEPIEAVGLVQDITERKEREQELLRTRNLIERTQESASIGWWEFGLDADTLTWSDETYRIHDLPADADVALEDGIEFYHPDDRETIRTAVDRAMTNGEGYDLELRIVTAKDSVRWVRTVADPQYNDAGELTGILGIFQDITDRKEREKRLEETKQRLSLALDATETGVWEWNLETDEVIWTNSMERLFGIEPGTFDGTYDAFAEHVHPDDLPAVEEEIERTVATGEPFQIAYRIQDEDATQRWGETRAELAEADDGSRRMIGIVTDITERKEKETELEARQEELRQIIDLVPDLVFVKSREGEYLLANEATAEAYGLTPEEVEGRKEPDIIPSVDDSDDFRADDLEVIESGERKKIPEEELTTADGETRILQTTKIPYRVPGGNEDAILGYARDVTELKQYEQLLETQRDNLDVLNKVVRHDVRNDLQLVKLYSENLASYVEEEGEEYLEHVRAATEDAIDITETAREVTEVMMQVDAEMDAVDLRSVLVAEVQNVRANFEDAEVTLEGSIPAVHVRADTMLESVFRNLLQNAIRHNDKPVPEVVVSVDENDEDVGIHFADNGPGIPDEQKREIFEEGAKGLESDGTGLGLYLVKTLVDRYGGGIRVEDNKPDGAEFILSLSKETASVSESWL